MTISPDLTWDTHINTILAKANRMLAFLRRNSVMSFTTDHRKLLYLTFVRSYIGYAREVWAPSISKNTGTGEMSYDTYGIFYIPVNFAFNLPNYVTSYMHYSGNKKKIVTLRLQKICFQGIQTRILQSVRTETLLSTSIFSKKSIFNAALCRFKYFDWARAEHPNNTCGRVSAALPHILHVTPPWVVPVFTPHTTGPCVRCTV